MRWQRQNASRYLVVASMISVRKSHVFLQTLSARLAEREVLRNQIQLSLVPVEISTNKTHVNQPALSLQNIAKMINEHSHLISETLRFCMQGHN